MAGCRVCGKGAREQTATGAYCRRCLARVLEKRIRKEVRQDDILSPSFRIICADDVSEYLVKSLYNDAKLHLSRVKEIPVRIPEGSIFLIKWSMDDEITDFLSSQMHGKKRRRMRKRTYSVLKSLTDEEIGKFSEYYRLRFIKNRKDRHVHALIEGMQEKYPETKYALYKSSKQYGK